MRVSSPFARTRPASQADARFVHALYEATPGYFDIISAPVPTLAEVGTELSAAALDPRRSVELVLAAPGDAEVDERAWPLVDGESGRPVVGYLDTTRDYPEGGDVTVNLLLVHSAVQSRGVGRACVADLEARLEGRARRVLASIYGRNPRAERFWRGLGYAFAIDARPVLEWYAKDLPATPAGV